MDRSTFLGGSELEGGPRYTTGSYLFLLIATIIIGGVTFRAFNTTLAPMLYDRSHIVKTAAQMHDGMNFATYDLNIETRLLRREHLRNLAATPDLIVMGASHWQEAHEALMPSTNYYNAHVHRDYYEDIVTIVHWLVKYDKIPKRLVISIRDNQFTRPEDRTDFLWVPILQDYRSGAAEYFGINPHRVFENGLTPQLRQILSLEILADNIGRYAEADELPHLTPAPSHRTLDVLRHDGSIFWSDKHRDGFTEDRTLRESRLLAESKADSPPIMDTEGIDAVDRVLEYLSRRGVEVYLAHPPFNPQVWDQLEGTPYMDGLKKVEELVEGFAQRYGFRTIGSFNPYDVGCSADMYIDGEHLKVMSHAADFFQTRPSAGGALQK
ncbi:MAG: hypothetical protein AAF497_02345, partial [Planctomycetota bacterium]